MSQAEVVVEESHDGKCVEIIKSEIGFRDEALFSSVYLTIEEVVKLIPKLEKIVGKSLER